ncbi:MAG: hypothetical protein ACKOHK_16470, partial [Planctomycetia bacterium]
LATLVDGKQQQPAGRPPAPPHDADPPAPEQAPEQAPKQSPGDGGKETPLPEAVRPLYEARRGFTNHHFNTVERDRVARRIAGAGVDARPEGRPGGRWTLAGRLATGEAFRIELSDGEGVIDLPTGTTRVDATGELDANPSPPGSGGMLAALLLWRRLVLEGPQPLGRTSYWGTVPLDPGSFGAAGGPRLVDMLETSVAGIEARFAVQADGSVAGIELWTAPDADPCEIRFGAAPPEQRPNLPAGVPASIEVRHGNELFGVFQVENAVLDSADADGGGT